jgi:hypothetical protein
MLPWLNKSKNKMVTTLLDARSGKGTEVTPDIDMSDKPEDEQLKSACISFLNAVERKSIPDLMAAAKEMHDACDASPHAEGEHTNEEELSRCR